MRRGLMGGAVFLCAGWGMAVVAIGTKRRSSKPETEKSPIARDAIAQAAAGLGGASRLVDWVNADAANERTFWGTIFPKLLSYQDGDASGVGEAIDEIRWTIVEARVGAGGVEKDGADGGA